MSSYQSKVSEMCQFFQWTEIHLFTAVKPIFFFINYKILKNHHLGAGWLRNKEDYVTLDTVYHKQTTFIPKPHDVPEEPLRHTADVSNNGRSRKSKLIADTADWQAGTVNTQKFINKKTEGSLLDTGKPKSGNRVKKLAIAHKPNTLCRGK